MVSRAKINDFATLEYQNGAPCIFRRSQVKKIEHDIGSLYNVELTNGREFTVKATKEQIVDLNAGQWS